MERTPKNILITGASSGIGQALAEHYARKGHRLFLSGRNMERLEEVKRTCLNLGAAGCETATIDVTDRPSMKNWIERIDGEHPLDIVYANAGISGGTGGGADSCDDNADLRIFETNLTGVLNTIHPAFPLMSARHSGQIVLISSMASFIPLSGAPAYSASKAAVRFYGEALAPKLKSLGISVSVVCPGFIESRMTGVNKFPMPFLMPADKAAKLIAEAVARKKVRIDFPWQMRLLMGIFGLFPPVLMRDIFSRLPEKES